MNVDRAERFGAYLKEYGTTPFHFGTHDCVTFAARWIEQESGIRMLDRIKAETRYDSSPLAYRCASRFEGYRDYVERYCGKAQHADAQHQRGDVGLYAKPGGPVTLGLLGDRLIYSPGKGGLYATGIENLLLHWRI
jgi:hypothetical protein